MLCTRAGYSVTTGSITSNRFTNSTNEGRCLREGRREGVGDGMEGRRGRVDGRWKGRGEKGGRV